MRILATRPGWREWPGHSEGAEMGKKHKDEPCDCIFCCSKCPECGSTEVEIVYRPEFVLSNNIENQLHFDVRETNIKMDCKRCGAFLSGEDERLKPLKFFLWKYLDIGPHTISFEPGGIIKAAREVWRVEHKKQSHQRLKAKRSETGEKE